MIRHAIIRHTTPKGQSIKIKIKPAGIDFFHSSHRTRLRLSGHYAWGRVAYASPKWRTIESRDLDPTLEVSVFTVTERLKRKKRGK